MIPNGAGNSSQQAQAAGCSLDFAQVDLALRTGDLRVVWIATVTRVTLMGAIFRCRLSSRIAGAGHGRAEHRVVPIDDCLRQMDATVSALVDFHDEPHVVPQFVLVLHIAASSEDVVLRVLQVVVVSRPG